MDNQQFFNVVLAIAGTLGGWWMKAMWAGLKDLHSDMTNLKVLVAGDYVKVDTLAQLQRDIFAALNRIEDKCERANRFPSEPKN